MNKRKELTTLRQAAEVIVNAGFVERINARQGGMA
jgi:hypothetical protein